MGKAKIGAIGVLLGIGLLGCKGPTGPAGPMGPSGASNSVPVYSQNFDGSGYTLSSQWTMATGGSTGTVALDTSVFLSAPDSLKVTGGVSNTGAVFTNNGVVTYNAANGNYFVDFYWSLAGITTSSVHAEAVLVHSGEILADLGFAVGSPNTFYVYSAGTLRTVEIVGTAPTFHHIVMVYHSSTSLSDYYDDGNLLAMGLNVGKSVSIAGTPNTWAGFVFPAGLGVTPDFFNIDNFMIYYN